MRSASALVRILSCAVVLGVSSMGATAAHADITVEQRCSEDSLTPAQAEQRLEWARKCALLHHTGGVNDHVSAGMYDVNGALMREYIDDAYATKEYTGEDRYINYMFMDSLYSALGTPEQFVDPFGFFKWKKPTKRSRPQYPTFGSTPDASTAQQLKPNATLSNCSLYNTSTGAAANNFYVLGYCTSSCYTPEQEILFPDGYEPIIEAVAKLRPTMITLRPESTLEDIGFMENDVGSYTAEIRDTHNVIFEIRTESHGMLRVTNQHPIVLGTGRLVQAEAVKVGDDLIQEDGTLDPVLSIEKSTFHGKVYNIKPQTTDPVSNLLIAQGYIVGSSRFQNDDVGYINRVILARRIPIEIIPE